MKKLLFLILMCGICTICVMAKVIPLIPNPSDNPETIKYWLGHIKVAQYDDGYDLVNYFPDIGVNCRITFQNYTNLYDAEVARTNWVIKLIEIKQPKIID